MSNLYDVNFQDQDAPWKNGTIQIPTDDELKQDRKKEEKKLFNIEQENRRRKLAEKHVKNGDRLTSQTGSPITSGVVHVGIVYEAYPKEQETRLIFMKLNNRHLHYLYAVSSQMENYILDSGPFIKYVQQNVAEKRNNNFVLFLENEQVNRCCHLFAI